MFLLDKILTPLKKKIARLLAMVSQPPKQPQTLTSKPARRLVYRLSRDSRYLVIHSQRFKVRTFGLK